VWQAIGAAAAAASQIGARTHEHHCLYHTQWHTRHSEQRARMQKRVRALCGPWTIAVTGAKRGALPNVSPPKELPHSAMPAVQSALGRRQSVARALVDDVSEGPSYPNLQYTRGAHGTVRSMH
jgi:hypothetical protein